MRVQTRLSHTLFFRGYHKSDYLSTLYYMPTAGKSPPLPPLTVCRKSAFPVCRVCPASGLPGLADHPCVAPQGPFFSRLSSVYTLPCHQEERQRVRGRAAVCLARFHFLAYCGKFGKSFLCAQKRSGDSTPRSREEPRTCRQAFKRFEPLTSIRGCSHGSSSTSPLRGLAVRYSNIELPARFKGSPLSARSNTAGKRGFNSPASLPENSVAGQRIPMGFPLEQGKSALLCGACRDLAASSRLASTFGVLAASVPVAARLDTAATDVAVSYAPPGPDIFECESGPSAGSVAAGRMRGPGKPLWLNMGRAMPHLPAISSLRHPAPEAPRPRPRSRRAETSRTRPLA